MKRPQFSRSAFTLIELLIAVSIIAILAAIATVNFLDAQSRSKVARVHADIRTLAGSLEAYRVDFHAYPGAAEGDNMLDQPLSVLSTPVAYISSVPVDPFGEAPLNFAPAITLLGYQYLDQRTTSVNIPAETYGHIWIGIPEKKYMLHSPGPNKVWDVSPYEEYDPTNGTVSMGDITRFGS